MSSRLSRAGVSGTAWVDPPAVPQHDVQPPGPPELAALLDRSSAAGDRLAARWALAIHTGCRQGELLGLNWADVDVDNPRL